MSKTLVVYIVGGIAALGLAYGFTYNREASSQAPIVAATEPTSSSTVEPTTSKARLLFFMNPNGRPCQIQDESLATIRSDIEKYADIVYFKTTNSEDESQFYRYGIRSLPSLIILNTKGEEFKRFSPGIQDPKEVLAILQELK